MHTPVLDDRLSRAAALFPACAYGADIGADHGRLSCFLLGSGRCARMCVADISAESLKKARLLLRSGDLEERADFSVGDGLSVLPQPAQAIAILGMGGRTVSGILERGENRLQGAALILSAHTEMFLVRKMLMNLCYRIDREDIARAAGRFYVILRAVPGEESCSEKACFLGPRLMEGCAEHYPEYLAWQIAMTARKRTAAAAVQLAWLKEEEKRVCHRTND